MGFSQLTHEAQQILRAFKGGCVAAQIFGENNPLTEPTLHFHGVNKESEQGAEWANAVMELVGAGWLVIEGEIYQVPEDRRDQLQIFVPD